MPLLRNALLLQEEAARAANQIDQRGSAQPRQPLFGLQDSGGESLLGDSDLLAAVDSGHLRRDLPGGAQGQESREWHLRPACLKG